MNQSEDELMKKLRKEKPKVAEIWDLLDRNLRNFGASEKTSVLPKGGHDHYCEFCKIIVLELFTLSRRLITYRYD